MEQQDHIATLCAAGTVGIAATGLALGIPTQNNQPYSTTPGKRKWPGTSIAPSGSVSQSPSISRRVVSQPATSSLATIQDDSQPNRSVSLFRRQSKREVRPTSIYESDATGSRASSTNRSGFLRPRTAETRSTSERRDASTSSSWMKRISTVSSQRSSSPGAPPVISENTRQQIIASTADSKPQSTPNKLVKRSTSQRGLSNDHARGSFLRRPATSHQRSATLQEWTPQETSYSMPVTPLLRQYNESTWRPFFDRGYARKRHTNANMRDSQGLRTISPFNAQRPMLILGSQLEPSDFADDQAAKTAEPAVEARTVSMGRQRLRRSLSSVHRASKRRHFTDPTVKVTTEAVNGTITPAKKQLSLSPASYTSTSLFNINPSQESPSFSSSPPLMPVRRRFSFGKRQSTVPSDPTTVSSEDDTKVFTDDDSMDFQSDTAYDSLNTRATVSSHSTFRNPKLDTIFADTQAEHARETDDALAQLVQKTTLSDDQSQFSLRRQDSEAQNVDVTPLGDMSEEMDFVTQSHTSLTPVKRGSPTTDNTNSTPIPSRNRLGETPFKSSPPSMALYFDVDNTATPELKIRYRQPEDDGDIDWSPKSDLDEKINRNGLQLGGPGAPAAAMSSPILPHQRSGLGLFDPEDASAEKRLSSIFDWSEHQKPGVDGENGMLVRPKTVHGKQGHDGSRSRSSGRKAPTQMHLRSQSVPNNRDPGIEQPPLSASKFGTWGLGNKPVSEEWSDDFDFDDAEEEEEEDNIPDISPEILKSSNRGTLRGVKVPQSIIDRQASVHIQFGQVQEFMLLVEELKQLRARGAALHLLESHSRQLWEDAESIIDLATINNEDDEFPVRSGSPTPFDIFGDETLTPLKNKQDKGVMDDIKRNSVAQRSVSSPMTPPHGRPRGESLAQAKNFLHNIHQSRTGQDSSPIEFDSCPQKKLPFDTQDLKDLVVRSGVITRALKEVVRKAEGLSTSPSKTPPRPRDPAFSQIFAAPDMSPSPAVRKPGLPKSKSANSYLFSAYNDGNGNSMQTTPMAAALVL